ncbi:MULTISPECIES: hypothetical protein [Nostoc]|uniref:hypothetical protein n=1 Tax=Nostoc TaxID=1177 RepID=UPI002FF91304
MQVYYQQHVFSFVLSPGDSFDGHLVLDNRHKQLLAGLLAAEDECWYLDENGERLPSEQLFALSPWSYLTPTGPIKLLCRFLDLRDGRAMFSTSESYLERGLYDWLEYKGYST